MTDDGDVRARFGAQPIINLTGTLTALGGISARPEAISAAAQMMARGVDMLDLQAAASRRIAAATGAEAGFVSACSSAGICMAIAGTMTGDSLAAIERLPHTDGLKDEVIIQTGHLVNYGHPIEQDIRLTGARVVSIGSVNAAARHELEGSIGPNTAAALYVVSHHTAPDGQIPFDTFAAACAARGVPVIVDLAAEYALHTYLDDGADITIHSAHKFLGGATAGLVCGRKSLVRAAFLQNFGIARPMKVGKEGVAAALAALECFMAEDRELVRAADREILDYWKAELSGYAGVQASLDPDPTGNPFDRLRITVDPVAAPLDAVTLVYRLETGQPSIRVRSHQLEHGSFVMDPRSLGNGESEMVAARIRAVLDEAERSNGTGEAIGDGAMIQAWRDRRSAMLAAWPDTIADSGP